MSRLNGTGWRPWESQCCSDHGRNPPKHARASTQKATFFKSRPFGYSLATLTAGKYSLAGTPVWSLRWPGVGKALIGGDPLLVEGGLQHLLIEDGWLGSLQNRSIVSTMAANASLVQRLREPLRLVASGIGACIGSYPKKKPKTMRRMRISKRSWIKSWSLLRPRRKLRRRFRTRSGIGRGDGRSKREALFDAMRELGTVDMRSMS